MKALCYQGPGKVRVEHKPEPRVEHPGDVILRVTRAAICGSDLHLYHGLIPDTRVGHTFGHEFTGVVEELGPAVRTLQRGDRVVVPFNIACGKCASCKRGLTALCENSNPCSSMACGVYGYSHTTGGYDGGQAEMVRVPFADFGPMKIPDDMSDEDVLLLSDILPTAYQGAEMGEIQVGDTVVVFGAGPVGILTARCAFLQGAARVIVVDGVQYRLEFAQRFARCEVVNYRQVDDVVAFLKRATDGKGADVCIDAVGCEASGSHLHALTGRILMVEAGNPVVISWCIDVVRKGGRVSIIGVYGPPANAIPIGVAMNKNVTIRMGQCNVKRYMPHLLEHIRAGRIDPTGIITHRISLDEVPDAYRTFARKEDRCIKFVVSPQASA